MPLQSKKLQLLSRISDIQFDEEASGYRKDQVDDVLESLAPLAGEIEKLQASVAEAESRAAAAEARLVEARNASGLDLFTGEPQTDSDFDETLRNTLVSAQRQADTTVREAKEEAERLRTEAEFQSNALLADARDQSAEMTTEAVTYRERMVAEANSEKAQMLDDAKSEMQDRLAAVEQDLADAHEAERAELIRQVEELTEKQRLLQVEVERFEEYMATRRSELKEALGQIDAVLDDSSLLEPEGIEPAELEEFSAEDYPPIAVEAVTLSELAADADQAMADTQANNEVLNAADLGDAELDETVAMATSEPTSDFGFDLAELQDMSFDEADDPQLGVETQVVPIQPGFDDASGEEASISSAAVTMEVAEIVDDEDPFVDQLRRVSMDSDLDSAGELEKSDRSPGGWFSRKR